MIPHRPAIVCLLLASLLSSAVGLAQQAAPAGEPAQKKEEARVHFDRGLTHVDSSSWDAALAEFLRSIEIFPTRTATKNAAFSLRKLNRHDEALDLYEGLLRDFRDLPGDF